MCYNKDGFLNRGRINPKFLVFAISKRLIKFSAMLQETYAIEDLKEVGYLKEIEFLLQYYTPQEVIREMRINIDNLDTFINNWCEYERFNNSNKHKK